MRTEFQADYQEGDYQVEAYVDCTIDYAFIFSDNTVVPVPEDMTWKNLQCLLDDTTCFEDNAAKSDLRAHRNGFGIPDGFMLWRL